MPISDEHEAIFLHIPRNAGTSIIEALDMYECRHHTYKYYQRKYPQKWEDYLTFSIVRHPFNRFVSAYNYARKEESYWHSTKDPQSAIDGKHPDYELLKDELLRKAVRLLVFTDQLKGQHWRRQYPFIYENKLKVDRLLRFEKLPDNFEKLFNVELPKKNSSGQKPELSNVSKKQLFDYYRKDFEVFDFEY